MWLANPLSGMDGSVAFRLHVVGTLVETREVTGAVEVGPGSSRHSTRTLPGRLRVRRVPIDFYEDVAVLDLPGKGAAVDLYAASDSGQFPLQAERRLLSLLYSRAEAHKL